MVGHIPCFYVFNGPLIYFDMTISISSAGTKSYPVAKNSLVNRVDPQFVKTLYEPPSCWFTLRLHFLISCT